MTLATTMISLAGIKLLGGFDGKGYYIFVVEFEKALEIRSDSTREIVSSKGLESALGKRISLGKKRVGSSFKSVVRVEDFSQLVGYLAFNGNTKAQALMMAVLAESIERRINDGLGIRVGETDYERNTRALYRHLGRTKFRDRLSSWHQFDGGTDYGQFVNEFKVALALPLINIEDYNQEQIFRYASGIESYHTLRFNQYDHKTALVTIRRQAADI